MWTTKHIVPTAAFVLLAACGGGQAPDGSDDAAGILGVYSLDGLRIHIPEPLAGVDWHPAERPSRVSGSAGNRFEERSLVTNVPTGVPGTPDLILSVLHTSPADDPNDRLVLDSSEKARKAMGFTGATTPRVIDGCEPVVWATAHGDLYGLSFSVDDEVSPIRRVLVVRVVWDKSADPAVIAAHMAQLITTSTTSDERALVNCSDPEGLTSSLANVFAGR